MANLTYFAANSIQNYLFGGVSFSVPSNWYLGVSSSTPAKDGSNVTEPTDGAYERIEILNSKASFSNSANGEIYNLAAHAFPESAEDQGVMTHWVIYSAASGGSAWFYGALANSRTVDISTILNLPIHSLSSTAS